MSRVCPSPLLVSSETGFGSLVVYTDCDGLTVGPLGRYHGVMALENNPAAWPRCDESDSLLGERGTHLPVPSGEVQRIVDSDMQVRLGSCRPGRYSISGQQRRGQSGVRRSDWGGSAAALAQTCLAARGIF